MERPSNRKRLKRFCLYSGIIEVGISYDLSNKSERPNKSDNKIWKQEFETENRNREKRRNIGGSMKQNRKWVWGASLLLMASTFSGGWWFRQALHRWQFQHSPVTAMQEFAPSFADARTLGSPKSPGEPATSGLYWNVLRLVRDEYVEKIDERKMAHGSIAMMLAAIDDPHTEFLTPHEKTRLQLALDGKLEGIGAILSIMARKQGDLDQQFLQVIAPMPGSPAERAGLKAGDLILEVDKQWIIAYDPFYEVTRLQRQHADRKQIRDADQRARDRLKNSMTLRMAIEQLSTMPGTKDPDKVSTEATDEDSPKKKPEPVKSEVLLTVKRGNETLKIPVKFAQTHVRPLDYRMINDRWGYVHLSLINTKSATQFTGALKALRARSKGLIIDLRNTAGGEAEPAKKILSQLVSNRQIAQVQYRQGTALKKKPMQLSTNPAPTGMPVVVLTNQGTYNVAEMFALALRTGAKAILVGMPTYGEASEISIYNLQDGSAFTLTTGRYMGSDGTDFHRRGIQPDQRVAGEPKMMGQIGADPALDRAITILQSKGGSRS
jgi:carboxyl-terminal processing protease